MMSKTLFIVLQVLPKAIHTKIINEDRGGPRHAVLTPRDVKQVKCHYVKMLT